MIIFGIGIGRELLPPTHNKPCSHPPYALGWRSPHSLNTPVPKKASFEDYVHCERCNALLAVDPTGRE